ncbi:ankyrin repeat-containing domain protein [Flagelloscypha sp. PMI_526]|nr:ankyrin repeat-containing domain protein [Flagelloscypha sp. PMI_526]
MSDPSELCIPADPDVSGIGVRIAIYAQNILTFIPAFYALWDGVVTHKELDSVRKHSTTILLTAFAILISAYVQASTNRLTNYHTIIVLNLSWMNNTNAFVYALLYIHHNGRSFLSWHAFYSRYIVSWSTFYHRYIRRVIHPSEWRTKDLIVFFLGSLHLSMMAILGIWFWSDRDTFGNFVACPTEPVISVIGVYVPFNSQALRAFSISLYSIVLTPILNLLLPMSLPCICYSLWHRKTSHVASRRSIAPIAICLFILLWLNILFAIDTELTLIHNRRLHGTGEGVWSFGQTLALLMLFPPLWDLGKSLWTGVKLDWEIKKLGKPEDAYKKAMLFERLDMIGDLAPKVNDPSVEGGRFGNALQLASHHGNLNLVKLLVDYGLNPNALVKSTSGTALQAAAARGNRKVVDYFVGKNVDVNALGGEFGTALQAAAFAGDAHSVMSLMSAGAHRNIKGGRYGTTLHAAVFSESELVVRLLVDSSEKISNVKEQRSPNADVIFFLPKRDNSVASSSRTNSLTTTCSSTLQDAPDFAAKDSDGNTALHLGVQRSSSNMVALLIKLGCNPDLRDRYLQTALHVGSKKGCTDIVRILLEGMAKADLKGMSEPSTRISHV